MPRRRSDLERVGLYPLSRDPRVPWMLGDGRVSATGGPASENNDLASGNESLTWERSGQQRATKRGPGLRPEVGEGSSFSTSCCCFVARRFCYARYGYNYPRTLHLLSRWRGYCELFTTDRVASRKATRSPSFYGSAAVGISSSNCLGCITSCATSRYQFRMLWSRRLGSSPIPFVQQHCQA